MFHDARRRFSSAAMIMLRRTLLARLLLPGLRLFHIRFGKCGRRGLEFFQFLDALVCCRQLLFQDTHSLQGLLELLF